MHIPNISRLCEKKIYVPDNNLIADYRNILENICERILTLVMKFVVPSLKTIKLYPLKIKKQIIINH